MLLKLYQHVLCAAGRQIFPVEIPHVKTIQIYLCIQVTSIISTCCSLWWELISSHVLFWYKKYLAALIWHSWRQDFNTCQNQMVWSAIFEHYNISVKTNPNMNMTHDLYIYRCWNVCLFVSQLVWNCEISSSLFPLALIVNELVTSPAHDKMGGQEAYKSLVCAFSLDSSGRGVKIRELTW